MKRFGSLIAAATCVVVFAVSGNADAALTQIAQCAAPVVVGQGKASCLVTFEVDEARRPATVGTHANFHATLAVGSITMEWVDPHFGSVAEWKCNAMGGFVAARGPGGLGAEAGPFDVSPHPNCTQKIKPEAAFVRGTQVLVVTGTATTCTVDRPQSSCLFHGALQLEPSFMPV